MTAAHLSVAPREDQLWPTLTPEQIARIAKRGKRRSVQAGDLLLEAGQANSPMFVVVDGEVVVMRPVCNAEEPITTYPAGSVSSEMNAIAGRPSVATIRVTQPGEVIEVPREA